MTVNNVLNTCLKPFCVDVFCECRILQLMFMEKLPPSLVSTGGPGAKLGHLTHNKNSFIRQI